MLHSSGPSPEAGWAPDLGSAPPPRHRPSEQQGRAGWGGRLWRGARVKADDPGACQEPCLLSRAVGPAGLGDQKLVLSCPLPQVWCNPRAQARTVSQDKCQRKPPGWSGSHSAGAAWSLETLRDTAKPRLAGDRSRPFLCPLSLRISTPMMHLPPPGTLQAFRGGLLRPLVLWGSQHAGSERDAGKPMVANWGRSYLRAIRPRHRTQRPLGAQGKCWAVCRAGHISGLQEENTKENLVKWAQSGVEGTHTCAHTHTHTRVPLHCSPSLGEAAGAVESPSLLFDLPRLGIELL